MKNLKLIFLVFFLIRFQTIFSRELSLSFDLRDLIYHARWNDTSLNISSDTTYTLYTKYIPIDPWQQVKGCINVTQNRCMVQTDMELWTDLYFQLKDNLNRTSEVVKIEAVDQNKHQNFSPIEFKVRRNEDEVTITYLTKPVKWWDWRDLPGQVDYHGYTGRYEIVYYSKDERNNKSKEMDLMVYSSFNNVTVIKPSFGPELKICIRVRFVFRETYFRINGKWNTKCIPGNNATVVLKNFDDHLYSKYKWAWISSSVLIFVSILTLVVCFCKRKYTKYYNKFFFINRSILDPKIMEELKKDCNHREENTSNEIPVQNINLLQKPAFICNEEEVDKLDFNYDKVIVSEDDLCLGKLTLNLNSSYENIPSRSSCSVRQIPEVHYVNEDVVVAQSILGSVNSIPYITEAEMAWVHEKRPLGELTPSSSQTQCTGQSPKIERIHRVSKNKNLKVMNPESTISLRLWSEDSAFFDEQSSHNSSSPTSEKSEVFVSLTPAPEEDVFDFFQTKKQISPKAPTSVQNFSYIPGNF